MRPATAAEATPCAVAARSGRNNAIVTSTPHDQTKRFIRTSSGMAEGNGIWADQTWRPPERSSIRQESHFHHAGPARWRSEEHTSELQSRLHLVCRLLLEKKKHTH